MDIVPDNVATLEYAFRDRVRAEKYLFTCYSYMPGHGTLNNPGLVCGDAFWYHIDANSRVQYGWNIMRDGNNVTAPLLNYWDGENGGTNLWQGIRDCNIFIENIGLAMGLDESERARWIAEVKFLKAYYHFWLLQLYGPIPIIRENLPISASASEVAVYREPVDDVVDYIVELLDEAMPDLPLKIDNEVTEMGRITQPIALAMKAKVLVTSASPLFNGNTNYSAMIDSRGKQLFNQTEDKTKWVRAAQACKNAIDTCHLAGLALYHFSNSSLTVSGSTLKVIECNQVITDKWNCEHIWGETFNSSYMYLSTLPRLATEHERVVYQMLVPTLKMAEMYYTNNGVPVDEDVMYDYEGRYNLATSDIAHKYYLQSNFTTAKLHMNREGRFYGSLGVDGGWWFGLGKLTEATQWPLKFKLGEVQGGRIGSERYSVTGFYVKKLESFMATWSGTTFAEKKYDWPVFRLADLYLLYAEALNESLDTPNEEVYKYIDMVRERAGLKGVAESWSTYSVYPEKYKNKEGMRKIVQTERNIELAFEGHRFWDMRRWGKAVEYFTQPIQGWNINGKTSTDFYHVSTIDKINYSVRDIFWPIKEGQLLVNRNLLQNPGW